jgi:hypothetical protein
MIDLELRSKDIPHQISLTRPSRQMLVSERPTVLSRLHLLYPSIFERELYQVFQVIIGSSNADKSRQPRNDGGR